MRGTLNVQAQRWLKPMMPNHDSTFAEATLNSGEESREKDVAARLRRYRRVALRLFFVLVLMVKCPLRIALPELVYDVIFYGTISLICVALAIQVGGRFGKRGSRLIAVFLLCSVLSGWQIFDLL